MDKLNKRIREFAEENGLYIMGHYNRDQYAKKHADREGNDWMDDKYDPSTRMDQILVVNGYEDYDFVESGWL